MRDQGFKQHPCPSILYFTILRSVSTNDSLSAVSFNLGSVTHAYSVAPQRPTYPHVSIGLKEVTHPTAPHQACLLPGRTHSRFTRSIPKLAKVIILNRVHSHVYDPPQGGASDQTAWALA